MPTTCIVTPSFAPDFERCRALLESIDKHVYHYQRHIVVVPARDLNLFHGLSHFNIELLTVEDLLSDIYWQLPIQHKWWVSKQGVPVRGWIIQQVIKYALAEEISCDALLYADSDIYFIKPFDVNEIWQEDKLRLYRTPRMPLFYNSRLYLNWYSFAAKTLGLTAQSLSGAYIAQLNSLHTKNVLSLIKHIENFYQKPWKKALLSHLDFSEYILYGVFVDEILQGANHWYSDKTLCHSSWYEDIGNKEQLKCFIASAKEQHVALHIQSNLNYKISDYL